MEVFRCETWDVNICPYMSTKVRGKKPITVKVSS